MHTSVSLLRNAATDGNRDAWFRLTAIYEPLIMKWVRQLGVNQSDSTDIAQEVLIALVGDLPGFEHNGRTGAFRTWLRRITVNRCRRYWTEQTRRGRLRHADGVEERLEELTDPASELSHLWDQEHDQFVVEHLLEKVRSQVSAEAMDAFRRVALNEESPSEVAGDLGVSTGQVYKFRYRVMRKLEERAEQLSLSIVTGDSPDSKSLRSQGQVQGTDA